MDDNTDGINDLTGQRFGRWTVLGLTSRASKPGQQTKWHCRCDCGKEKTGVLYSSLMRGLSVSCGCFRTELMRKRAAARRANQPSVRQLHPREYIVWQQAKHRCFNPNCPKYSRYGGRGITMCEEWRNSFAAFIEHMGPCPKGLTLDRIDNDGSYTPGNCRWTDMRQQSQNRCNALMFQWRGETRTLSQIARMENVSYGSLYMRVMVSGGDLEKNVRALQAKGLTFSEKPTRSQRRSA